MTVTSKAFAISAVLAGVALGGFGVANSAESGGDNGAQKLAAMANDMQAGTVVSGVAENGAEFAENGDEGAEGAETNDGNEGSETNEPNEGQQNEGSGNTKG